MVCKQTTMSMWKWQQSLKQLPWTQITNELTISIFNVKVECQDQKKEPKLLCVLPSKSSEQIPEGKLGSCAYISTQLEVAGP